MSFHDDRKALQKNWKELWDTIKMNWIISLMKLIYFIAPDSVEGTQVKSIIFKWMETYENNNRNR